MLEIKLCSNENVTALSLFVVHYIFIIFSRLEKFTARKCIHSVSLKKHPFSIFHNLLK